MLRLFVTMLVLAFAVPAHAQDADMTQRLEAARRYAATMPSRDMVRDMLTEIQKNPAVALTPQDVAQIQSSIDFARLDAYVQTEMAKVFTLDELKALGDFYTSPIGQGIVRKMPQLTNTVMPVIQQEVLKVVTPIITQRMTEHMAVQPGAVAVPRVPLQ